MKTPEENITEVMTRIDALVDSFRNMNMPPYDLLVLQTEMTALRYYAGTWLTVAEERLARAKNNLERHIMKQTLTLKRGPKMTIPEVEATIAERPDTIALQDTLLSREIDVSGLKNRMHNSKDIVIAIQARLGAFKEEAISSRMQTSHS